MEHQFFRQQGHKERFLAEMNKNNTSNMTLDPLTGLPDVQVFTDRLLQALNQSKRHKMSFAVMILNLRGVSTFNEELGYDAGDKIIIETANRLKKIIRQVDTVVRYIGSDFVFLLPLLSKPETAAYVAQRAQDALMKPFDIDGKEISVSANMGISIYPVDGEDEASLLKRAEDALQQAKLSGKNTYQFYQKELQMLGQRELSITACFRSANFTDYLLVRYQPHIDVETNQVTCIQAILYFKHPEYGLIPFSEFCKLSENAGRIVEIGEFLLKISIAQFKQWDSENFKPPLLSITVSMKQIENTKFLQTLSQVLQETGFDAKKIMFEISENVLAENSKAVENGFEMLARLGIKISVGIFALGHFAINKISKIPIDYLKIDGRLIQDVLTHDENKHILVMIIGLAKDSKITVVADGIENKEEKILLTQLGCRIMQGKLFSAPQEADTIEHEYHH